MRSSTLANAGFRGYVRELRALTASALSDGGVGLSALDLVEEHLNGRVNRELRRAVTIHELRARGAFFTGHDLARSLLASAPSPHTWGIALDPACGCGDLLLAAAARLPVRPDLAHTLAEWGAVLRGIDQVPEFIEVARQRLVLLALSRGARPSGRAVDPDAAFAGLKVADSLSDSVDLADAGLILLNPPYGQRTAPRGCAFASGLLTEAAIWIDEVADKMTVGTHLAAILPDVLRSGSRYARWRQRVEERLHIESVEPFGQFDALTDVDVFGFRAQRVERPSRGWPSRRPAGPTLGDVSVVTVGPVVPHRDPQNGPRVAFVTARDLPATGTYIPNRVRRYSGRVFTPPFLVVRRTSRPTQTRPRLNPVLIGGDGPVAVENHLLVLIPEKQNAAACRRLALQLQEPAITAWLNRRIRLRHMTVTALREVPLRRAKPAEDRT